MKRKSGSESLEPSSKRPRLQPSLDSGQNTARDTPKTTGSRTDPELSGDPSQNTKNIKKKNATPRNAAAAEQSSQSPYRKEKIRKLAPPRPFPSVPPSVSTSGPKSAHKEGANYICITRHTPLAAYLKRCRKILVEDGYSTLHLHGMGAAIPHLLTLSVSLPPILPYPKDEIDIEVRTGTIEVMDEIIPDDEDEDISVRTRGKGGVSVLLKVRNGNGSGLASPLKSRLHGEATGGNDKQEQKRIIVVQEQEQDDEMDQDEGS